MTGEPQSAGTSARVAILAYAIDGDFKRLVCGLVTFGGAKPMLALVVQVGHERLFGVEQTLQDLKAHRPDGAMILPGSVNIPLAICSRLAGFGVLACLTVAPYIHNG